ncbi:hypothetical protein C1H76_7022 [Elsinoe australis]|uniref:Uncharacterized protein n=1 Tax=Elsinoe australis TaxID=40998 RepID=A0A4U7AVY1_9PEZI|nr:hypothetical protein C1H76_7022 [Elsinoe australis]
MSAATAVTYAERRTQRSLPSRYGQRRSHQQHNTGATEKEMTVSPAPRNPDLPKSASYTYLPTAKETAYSTDRPITIRGDTSSEDLTAPLDSADVSPPDSSGWTTPSDEIKPAPDVIQHLSAELEKIPRISVGHVEKRKSATSSGGSSQELEVDLEQSPRPPRSFASRLTRRMSAMGSRSPSPSKNDSRPTVQRADSANLTPSPSATSLKSRGLLRKRESRSPSKPAVEPEQKIDKPVVEEKKTKRISNMLSRKSSNSTLNATLPPPPSKIFLPKSFSTDRLHSVSEAALEENINAPLPSPRILNTERNSSLGSLALPRKRDELWNIFRQLDGDYAKFSSKSTSFKANVVRQSLLPFLRNYHDHPSNRGLRAEDLDRRTAILNKWWVGLLDMINGKNNQSVSGTDRPAILDALSGLMDRPEWRPSPSMFCPLAHRHTGDLSRMRNKSSTSVASMGSEFLTESVMHNVRNLFVQNLNTQMAFAVEKMSLRSASASLITFCGKAIAYAFYFCPGIADVLVRMWTTDADTFKRVLGEHGIAKFDNIKDTSDEIVSSFPPAVHGLAFVSLAKMLKTLRQPVELPPMSASMQFWGYWSDRWLGNESDLLYVFVKHYFILANDYLPAEATKTERIAAPGMLAVQAQLLTNLDSTINRNVNPSSESPSHSSPTFDDFLGGPDAVVSTLPLLPPNATRAMNENRLIMLIRDVLSERASDSSKAQHLFAISFMDMLHASARGVSIFNHAACYTLCDFLEEALHILVRYEQRESCPGPIIDSAFWLDVFRKMLTSHNTVTEIRLYAFLYTVWGIVCSSPERKEDLCLNLLLDESVFERTFTHWCPMVRAYFMRLMCWRVGRFDGNATQLDTQILETLFARLRKIWAYHMYEREQGHMPAPSMLMPCNPAPGRRFLVVRTDTQVAPGGSFLAFNGIMPPLPPGPGEPGSNGMVARRALLSAEAPMDRPLSVASNDSDLESPTTETGLRGFLRGMLGGSKKRSESPRETRPKTGTPDSKASSANTLRSPEDGRPRERTSNPSSRSPSRPPAQHHSRYSFKFSLEFVNKPTLPHPNSHVVPRLMAPRLPVAAMRYLHEVHPNVPPCQPIKPQGEQATRMMYVGRALAEWTIVVGECQAFFERRRQEGVPEDRAVETPTLGVELFRRSG